MKLKKTLITTAALLSLSAAALADINIGVSKAAVVIRVFLSFMECQEKDSPPHTPF